MSVHLLPTQEEKQWVSKKNFSSLFKNRLHMKQPPLIHGCTPEQMHLWGMNRALWEPWLPSPRLHKSESFPSKEQEQTLRAFPGEQTQRARRTCMVPGLPAHTCGSDPSLSHKRWLEPNSLFICSLTHSFNKYSCTVLGTWEIGKSKPDKLLLPWSLHGEKKLTGKKETQR